MSTVKSPQEKKRLSLKKDCRNIYGESQHAARKSIPRRKQIQHQEERRAASQALASVDAASSEDAMASAEVRAATKARRSRLEGFRKEADAPLEVFIERQRARRLRGANCKKLARG